MIPSYMFLPRRMSELTQIVIQDTFSCDDVYNTLQILSTDHELIPARNANLAAMHGYAGGSNIRHYPTLKHSPLK
jgi:hypothetical protein